MNFVEFLDKYHGIQSLLADRYGDWLGYEIQDVTVEEDKIVTSLVIRDDHLPPSGAVHGGVISGFLDFSCGCAVFTVLEKGQLCSTVELNVKYFKPLKNKDRIQAQAEVINRGKTLCSVIAKVYKVGSPNPVALATGTFNIYNPRSTKLRS